VPSRRNSKVWIRCGSGRLAAALVLAGTQLAVAAIALADGGVERGIAAYERGELRGAAAMWLPLAERGDPKAQTALGLAYYHGQGVPQDFGAAAAWYRRAADQGYPYAQGLLGYLYFIGQGVHQDYVEAHFWLNLAAAGLPPGPERDLVIDRRGVVQTMLSPRELHDVQVRATVWRPVPIVPETVQ